MTDTSTQHVSRQGSNLVLPMHSVVASESPRSPATASTQGAHPKRGIRVRVNSLGAGLMFKNASAASSASPSPPQPAESSKPKGRNRSATVTAPEMHAASSTTPAAQQSLSPSYQSDDRDPAATSRPPLSPLRHPLLPSRNKSVTSHRATASKEPDPSTAPSSSSGFNRRKFFGRSNSIRSLLGGSAGGSSSNSTAMNQSSSSPGLPHASASTAGPADAPPSRGLLRRMGSKSLLNLNQIKAGAAGAVNNASSDDLSSTASIDSHASKRFSDSLKSMRRRRGNSVSKDSSKSRSVSSHSSAEAYAARVMRNEAATNTGSSRKSIESTRSSRSVTSPEPQQPHSSEADFSDHHGHNPETQDSITSAPRRLTGWLYNMVGSDNTPSSIEGGAPLSPVREVDALDLTPSSPTPHRNETRDQPSSSPSQTNAGSSRNDADRSASPLGTAPTRSKAGALFHSLTSTGTGRAARMASATTGENTTSASVPSSNGNSSLSQAGGSTSNTSTAGNAGGGNGGSWIPGGAGFDRAFKFFMDSDAGTKDDEGIWLLGVWHGPKQSQSSALPSTAASGPSDTTTKGQEAGDVPRVARASSPSSSLSASSPRRTPVDLIHTSLASSSPSYDRAGTPAAREESRVGSSISTAATASTADSLHTKSSATSFNVVSQPSASVASDQQSAFQPDFASRIWCTYRNHFAPIARDGTISEQAASAAESSAAAQQATVQETCAPSTPSAAPSSSEAARSSSPPASAGRSWLGRKLTESNVGQDPAMQASSQPLGLGAALGAGYANASSTLGDKMGITGLWSRATAAAQAAGFSRAGLTTDSGWGCMLRTGQSLLANALINVHLGRTWLREAPPARQADFLEELASLSLESSAEKQTLLEFREKRARHTTYIKILSWFLDDPSPACPFGVHRMAREGKRLGKEVGEWFGPSTAAGAIKQLVSEFPDAGLAVELAHDGVFYLDEVRAAAGATNSATTLSRQSGKARASTTTGTNGRKGDAVTWRRPVLILIGIRLGLDSVNPIYYESVKATFSFPHSVGIAGGRPSSSYYFMGHQGNSLFYLDPHNVRPAVPLRYPPSTFPAAVPRQLDVAHRFTVEDKDDEDEWWSHAYTEAQTSTFHCEKVRRMPIKSLDPSMLLGFLVKDEEDLVDLCARIKALPKTIFSFADSAPKWVDDDDFDPSMESFSEPSVGAESEDEAEEGKDGDLGADVGGEGKQGGPLQNSKVTSKSEGAPVPFPTSTDGRSNDKMYRESQERTAAWLGQGHPASSSSRSPYANRGSGGGGGIAFPSLDLLSPSSDAQLQRPARMDTRQVSTSSAATTRPSRHPPADSDLRTGRDLTASSSTGVVAGKRSSSSRSPAKLGAADESFSTVHLSDSEVGSGWEEVSDGGTIAASSSAGVGLWLGGSSAVVRSASGGGGGVQQEAVSPSLSEGGLGSLSLEGEVQGGEKHTPDTTGQSVAGLTSAHRPLALPRRRSQSKPTPPDMRGGLEGEVPPVPALPALPDRPRGRDVDSDASDDDF